MIFPGNVFLRPVTSFFCSIFMLGRGPGSFGVGCLFPGRCSQKAKKRLMFCLGFLQQRAEKARELPFDAGPRGKPGFRPWEGFVFWEFLGPLQTGARHARGFSNIFSRLLKNPPGGKGDFEPLFIVFLEGGGIRSREENAGIRGPAGGCLSPKNSRTKRGDLSKVHPL